MQTFVGVYVSQKKIAKLRRGKPDYTYLKFVEANKEAQTKLVFFSIKGVQLNNRRISGVYYNEGKGEWKTGKFPYPDVIYKRGGTSVSSVKERVFKKQLEKSGVKPLNKQSAFNKWHVYKVLNTCPDLKKYLLQTEKFRHGTLLEMLKDHGTVYLKAHLGSLGERVMRVIKTEEGYHCSYFIKQLYTFETRNVEDLLTKIRSFFKKRNVLIQQGIDVLTFNGCNVDFRAEVQRNGTGNLEVVAVPVRMGGENSPITTHASTYTFETFFKTFMKYSDEQIIELKAHVDQFLIKTYECLENTYGPLCEAGIDFGIDINGQIWFIECNSRSTKESVRKAYDKNTVTKLYLNPLLYARHIAGKS